MSGNPVPRSDPAYGMSLLAYPSKRRIVLTPLNIEISRRYQACEDSGGHQLGSESVYRWLPKSKGEDVKLRICVNCSVPIVSARTGNAPSPWTISGGEAA